MAKSLLLVDDSATMRKIILRTLRMAGLDIDNFEEAGDGNEALEKLNAQPADIMLCDINMPGMGGLELVKKVREMDSCNDTKIVMISTESSDDLIESVMADGANGYVTKPFTPESIQKALSPLM
ncbi:putative chemotaxis protein CheY [Anaerohalosphaera lusitana]|uniref:Putative chemotaxis protein CheY n=1 Tax=Anaerohalosphaera lusitana TaxID=1936003 RepID=A0A1U9NGL2_9BACT|nr:response regulator [Anaerohalosphaera lusitana]AQT66888.1 putative chemotaxis protein CheY [Anaerohalosphaera lusitana]